MIKRLLSIISILILGLLSFSTIGYSACSLNSQINTCEVISEAFNTFTINSDQIESLEKYNAVIYNNDNPSNIIKTKIDGNSITNINPFMEIGAYTLRITSSNKALSSKLHEFEFLFDNTQLNPPIIPLELISETNTITITGISRNAKKVFAKFETGPAVEISVEENGDFSQDLTLSPGLNYVQFYNTNSNGINSEIVERVIISDSNYAYNENVNGAITINSNLENFNFDTSRLGENNYLTFKRNFFIKGTVQVEGAKVYANGNPTISTKNGDFGVFVNLNEGENVIEVRTKNSVQTLRVNYEMPKFYFEEIDFPLIVNSENAVGNIKANLDLEYDVYLNGELNSNEKIINGLDTVSLNNLIPGKNYIYIKGYNGETYNSIIYRDTETPIVTILSGNKFVNAREIFFKVEDDLGIKFSDMSVSIGSRDYIGEDINNYGDIYGVDISNLTDGNSYTIFVSGKDRVGKDFGGETSKNFSKDSEFALIENVEGAKIMGNNIYVDSGLSQLVFKPSKFIAFNSIYLDGVRQDDYQIKSNKDVIINLDFTKKTGELEFTYIDKLRNPNTQTFNYISDSELPILELDYIYNTVLGDWNSILITGEITDSHFDWNSLKFDSSNKFNRFGNYFEAFVNKNDVTGNSVQIFGKDYSSNSISSFPINIYKENSDESDIEIERENENAISGDINTNINVKKYLNSYDGFKFKNSYFIDSFELASAQRHGLRSVNFYGYTNGGKLIRTLDKTSIGNSENQTHRNLLSNLDFEMFFNGNDVNTIFEDGIIQGQIISNYDLTTITISPNGNCEKDEYNFVCIVDNLEFGENNFTVSVSNSDGKTIENSFVINRIDNDISLSDIGLVLNSNIYLKNQDYFTTITNYDLEGNVNKEVILSLIVNGREIYSGKNNGDYLLNLNLDEELGAKSKDELEVYVIAKDEYGNTKESNKIKIVFNRILETLVEVFIN